MTTSPDDMLKLLDKHIAVAFAKTIEAKEALSKALAKRRAEHEGRKSRIPLHNNEAIVKAATNYEGSWNRWNSLVVFKEELTGQEADIEEVWAAPREITSVS